ncbi:MAG: NlpC/P60 family protein [Smithella sp.]
MLKLDKNLHLDYATHNHIKTYFEAQYPFEACGLIINNEFVPIKNVAQDRYNDFKMPDDTLAIHHSVDAVVHSHTNGNYSPSPYDMEQQIKMGIPWGLSTVNENVATDVYFWGDTIPNVPLEGREFRSGPTGTDKKGDCYALIRDYYRTVKGITIKEFPRDSKWWESPESNDPNMYLENFQDAGFMPITQSELQAGDIILMRVMARDRNPNHGGIYLGNNQLLHHIRGRYSRKEVVNNWLKMATHYLRYNL